MLLSYNYNLQMNIQNIPINKPSITELEISLVNDAVKNGWGNKCYEYISQFEKDFTKYQGSEYALATSSCTGAIHLSLMAMGLKEGDEVIVPDITWIASVEPVLYIGAKPVFVDVMKDTWCIDPAKIEASITAKTKGIIVVHLYGNLVEMDAIKTIAQKHSLWILEDAAEGLGSEYKGQKAGSIGDIGVFSFHGTKTMTTGEGGILVTNNEIYIERARILNDHGRNPKIGKTFWMEEYGYKYKMSNLQAALGCAQISRMDELVEKKRLIFSWYKELLKDVKGQLNPEATHTKNSYWLPTIILSEEYNFEREAFFVFSKKNNIDSRPFFYPLSSLPMFTKIDTNIVSYTIYERGINLPSFHDITYEQVERVCLILKTFLNGER